MTEERLAAFGEAWNTHDAALVMSFMADDCVFHASVGPELLGRTYVGADDVRRGVQAFFDRYPDGRFDDGKAFVAGDHGASEWTFSWTGDDGERMAVRGCDLFEFAGDLIKVKNAFRKNPA
jgi:ketosteroid isomerase-like protein